MFGKIGKALGVGGGDVFGGLLGGIGGLYRNKEARKASARQMAFQERMSNTAYQRTMDDMRKAGLNPILAGKVGGASTPTGSTYNPENMGQTAVQAMQASNNARVLRNTAKLSDLDVKAFSKIGVGPQFANTNVINKIGNTGLDGSSSIGQMLRNIKENIQDKMNPKYEGSMDAKTLNKAGFQLRLPNKGNAYWHNKSTGEKIYIK
jgi:hypothetical protein